MTYLHVATLPNLGHIAATATMVILIKTKHTGLRLCSSNYKLSDECATGLVKMEHL